MITKLFDSKTNEEVDLSNLGKYGFSISKVEYKCDNCGKVCYSFYYDLKRKNRLETQFCRSCTIKLNDVVVKRKETCIKKYGVDNFSKTKIKKLDYQDVKNYIESEGYLLISSEYENSKTKIEIKCPNNHTFKVKFNDFQQGHRCKICSIKNSSAKRKLDFDYIKSYIESFNYKLLSKEYHNNTTELILECDKGHIYKTNWNKLKSGYRCSVCNPKKKLTYEYVKSYIESFGYKLLSSEYINASTKLEIECNKGHIYKVKWNYFQLGRRCPVCYKENNIGENSSTWKGGVSKLNIPLYDTYAPQIEFCEEVRRDPEDEKVMQVKCTHCDKWFTPTRVQVSHRLAFINKYNSAEGRFYCSENCKQLCIMFNQKIYPKGYKPYKDNLERDPYWKQLVLERDNFECQICGSVKNLEAHHIDSIHTNPIMLADLENGITFCKECHKKVHSEPGCRYSDLTKNQVCKK